MLSHRSLPPLPAQQGAAIERFSQMTDWGYYEAARRFQRVLVAAGIDTALKARGALVSAAPLRLLLACPAPPHPSHMSAHSQNHHSVHYAYQDFTVHSQHSLTPLWVRQT